MSGNLRSTLDNADMQAAPQALLRAARRAREIARRTGTRLIVVHHGVRLELDADRGARCFWRRIELRWRVKCPRAVPVRIGK
jgi:sugar phosphate isomerase/epimerase